MNFLKTVVLTALLMFAFNFQSMAQTEISNDRTKFSIEVDPATFVFKGYGIHFRIQPKGSEHLLIGLGTYAMDLPDVIVNFNTKNKDQGWDVRINQGYGLFGEYHFTEVNRRWFVGTQIGLQEFKIQNSTMSSSEKFKNILTMGYFGYTLKPFKNNLYFKPWVGVGYTSKITGNNTLEESEYDIAPITMFATLHIGYTF